MQRQYYLKRPPSPPTPPVSGAKTDICLCDIPKIIKVALVSPDCEPTFNLYLRMRKLSPGTDLSQLLPLFKIIASEIKPYKEVPWGQT